MALDTEPGVSPYKLGSSSGTKHEVFEHKGVLTIEESAVSSHTKTPKKLRYTEKDQSTAQRS